MRQVAPPAKVGRFWLVTSSLPTNNSKTESSPKNGSLCGCVSRQTISLFVLRALHFVTDVCSSNHHPNLFLIHHSFSLHSDFCLIPMGPTESGPTISVGVYIAECQRVLESYKSKGISYEVRLGKTNRDGLLHLVPASSSFLLSSILIFFFLLDLVMMY